jgi:septal ring factor EnvC (AmiA/AmiB activator)
MFLVFLWDVETWKSIGEAFGALAGAIGATGLFAHWRLRKERKQEPPKEDEIEREATALRKEYLQEIERQRSENDRLRRVIEDLEGEIEELRTKLRDAADHAWSLERKLTELTDSLKPKI